MTAAADTHAAFAESGGGSTHVSAAVSACPGQKNSQPQDFSPVAWVKLKSFALIELVVLSCVSFPFSHCHC